MPLNSSLSHSPHAQCLNQPPHQTTTTFPSVTWPFSQPLAHLYTDMSMPLAHKVLPDCVLPSPHWPVPLLVSNTHTGSILPTCAPWFFPLELLPNAWVSHPLPTVWPYSGSPQDSHSENQAGLQCHPLSFIAFAFRLLTISSIHPLCHLSFYPSTILSVHPSIHSSTYPSTHYSLCTCPDLGTMPTTGDQQWAKRSQAPAPLTHKTGRKGKDRVT